VTKPRIRVPSQARKGEVIEVKTLISHAMETGHRRDSQGQLIPRHIIHTFTCTYNGAEVFRADWHPAVAANPYLAFYTVATESGQLRFEWTDDAGAVYTAEAEITVV
jgi:sulfur-oxidizing protein SoxZ